MKILRQAPTPSKGWIGVDLDRTLAEAGSQTWGATPPWEIGAPVPLMVERVKKWRKAGIEVRIFTARVFGLPEDSAEHQGIQEWCMLHLGEILPITCCKDFQMIALWDDRAIHVAPDKGTTTAQEAKAFKQLLKEAQLSIQWQ